MNLLRRTYSSLIPETSNDQVQMIKPAQKSGTDKSASPSNVSTPAREEFNALCRLNDQKMREIPSPEQTKKPAAKSKR